MSARRTALLTAACLWLVAACLAQTPVPSQSGEPNLSEEQMREFLLGASVVRSEHTDKGVTSPWRLTLSDGTLTHDAIFQSVDYRQPVMQFPDGRTELNFRDSYHHNIAAYELAKLLGMQDLVPMYVERTWNRETGSMGWWLPVRMDEGERLQSGEQPPDPDAWNQRMHKIRVLNNLAYDIDSNLTNIVITQDWEVWRIDFTRAFRHSTDLRDPGSLVMCPRAIFERLRDLDRDEVNNRIGRHLTQGQIDALMARRAKIVVHFEQLIAEKGEASVLF